MEILDITALKNIWGSSEVAYSRVVAQTLALSSTFRKSLVTELRSKLTEIPGELSSAIERSPIDASTEHILGENGRIDIVLRFGKTSALGIENKTISQVRPNQLKDYADWFKKHEFDSWILFFLGPSRLVIPEAEKPRENFASLTYLDLQQLATRHLSTAEKESFEAAYFRAFAEYCGELEMEHLPLTRQELDSLSVLAQGLLAESKLLAVVDSLESEFNSEPRSGKHVLKCFKRNGLTMYAGFRLGTKWYFGAPLLNGRPEALVYVKNEGSQLNQAHNRILKEMAKSDDWNRSLGDDVNAAFYAGELARFAVRRNLDAFEGKSHEEIGSWLIQAVDSVSGEFAARRRHDNG